METRTRRLLILVALLMALLMGAVAALQYRQWQVVEQSLQSGQNAESWNYHQVNFEHLRLRKQLDEVLHIDHGPEAMGQLALRFQIFASRLDLITEGRSARLLEDRPEAQARLAALRGLVDSHADALAGEDSPPTFDTARLRALRRSLEDSARPIHELLLLSNSQYNITTTSQLRVIREQLQLAAVSSGVLSALALAFATIATAQLRLANRRLADLHLLNDEIRHRASHDTLTALHNRDEFERRLQQAWSAARTDGTGHALLYLDLDHFKLINDRCGHAAGDRLLREVASLLRESVRAVDTLARLGGDEFGLILAGCSESDAQAVAQQLGRRVDAYRFVHEAQTFHVGASIGLVLVQASWPSTTALLQAADSACFVAKQAGRNRIHVYRDTDPDVQLLRSDMRWLQRLENALDEDRLELFWQRIVPLPAGADRAENRASIRAGIRGEVLLRLREDGERLSPGAFLPVAERYGLITRIDCWVVTRVFDWLERHHDRLQDLDGLAINLSGHSLGDSDFHCFMLEQLNRRHLPAEKVVIEITETAAITRLGSSAAFIEALRQRRLRVALDDFGSGMSSFGYLKGLPVDYLKIDGQFIRNLEHDRIDQATLRAISDVAQASGLKTIAEWVESAAAAALLRNLGIDYGQGHHWHRPEPLDTLASQLPQPAGMI